MKETLNKEIDMLDLTEKNNILRLCNETRKDILEMVYSAGSGHMGGSLSAVEILTVLYNCILKPEDKFILSKGHAAPLYYSILSSKGYIDRSELKNLRNVQSNLEGHPSRKIPGVDSGSGSLGQGLSIANGMALAKKIDEREGKVFCLLGDGELEEGQVWEAAMTAGYYKLNNVVAIVDYNNLQIDGNINEVMSPEPIKNKFIAFNWNVIDVDGHDVQMLYNGLKKVLQSNKPTCIIAHTIKGKGISFMEDNVAWHGKAPNYDEYIKAKEELNNEIN